MASPIARLWRDSAGGPILSPGANNVFANGFPVSLGGDLVQKHGKDEHSAATILTRSNKVFANNAGVCRMNDTATCGHSVISDSNVFAG